MSIEALQKLDFVANSRLPVFRQSEANECGNTCLAMIANYHGYKVDLGSLRRKFPISARGVRLRTLMDSAQKVGFATRALKAEIGNLHQVRLPAILHWDLSHFVVLKSVSKSKIVVHDPAKGRVEYSMQEFSNHFTGIVLELEPTSGFEKKREKADLKLSNLWTSLHGLWSSVIQVLILSAVLQLFIIVGPFYLQITVDEVLPSFDFDLLLVLAIGFAIFTVINVTAQVIRGYVILFAGSSLGYQIVLNLFSHLIRLPLPFFEKRHIGDIVSRFSSAIPIKDFLTEGIAVALIDGAMAIITLGLMFVYSPILGSVVLVFTGIYFVIRATIYRSYRHHTESAIVAEAHERTNFIETVRGIMSIKLFAHEGERQHKWQNLFADSINQQVKVERLRIWANASATVLSGLEHVLLIFLAAQMVMEVQFSIGMIFAFMAYRQQFVTKVAALVEKMVEFKMLDLHLDRLADIAQVQREESQGISSSPVQIEHGTLSLENVSFSYESDTPDVLSGITLDTVAGETIAITGASGSGKTTLMKLMLGLLEPTTGEVRVDGVSLEKIGLSNYRKQIAAVMQNDELFAGSLSENISFFDPNLNMKKVIECTIAACIHDDILAMPMAYESYAGDMGSTLSGGQKQRLLLARALYANPKILFVDEGTAHLDIKTEAAVNKSIRELGITRVIIAHRTETIKMADRVVVIESGRIA